jgi:hypothetical protein
MKKIKKREKKQDVRFAKTGLPTLALPNSPWVGCHWEHPVMVKPGFCTVLPARKAAEVDNTQKADPLLG